MNEESPRELTESSRFIQLEMSIAHLQRDVEHMNEVLLRLQDEIRLHQKSVDRLEYRLQKLDEPAEIRDPLMERPPHY